MATNNSCDYSPTQYNVQVGGANGTLSNVAPSATSGVPVISQGSSSNPVFGTALVAGGGTGAVTLTANGVLLGNTTSAITATAAGTTGQVLTGVTGSAPTFQSPAASSITITGDSGGGLTGNSFTFTGSATGLTFAGAGSTETLGGTLVVANGGTGAATLTSHGVLLGNTTSAVTATAAGTTGQVLTGVTGAAPTFQSPAASSISITGDSGGALTGAAFTLTGGTTGLTFAGAGSTETLGGTLVVSNGGTGLASATAYAVLTGGTTSTGAFQSIASVGTSGQVLTSNGAGALPTFQAAGGGGITSATVSITSAQVKALHATPITIIATPGANKLLVPVGAAAEMHYGGTNAFTNTGSGNVNIYYGSASGTILLTGLLGASQITSTSNQTCVASINLSQGAATTMINNALVVANSSATEFAGNAAGDNTISVTIWYATITP